MSFHKESGGFNGVDCGIERVGMKSGLMLFEVGVVKGIGFFHFKIISYVFVL